MDVQSAVIAVGGSGWCCCAPSSLEVGPLCFPPSSEDAQDSE